MAVNVILSAELAAQSRAAIAAMLHEEALDAFRRAEAWRRLLVERR